MPKKTIEEIEAYAREALLRAESEREEIDGSDHPRLKHVYLGITIGLKNVLGFIGGIDDSDGQEVPGPTRVDPE
jgi:hypothetical protein